MLNIKTIQVTPFEQNSRIVFDETSREAVIIDPGGDVSSILKNINELNAEVSGVLLTHSHIDHAGGVAELLSEVKKIQGVKPLLYGHAAEKEMRSRISDQALMFGLSPHEYQNCPEPDVYVDEGSEVKLAGYAFSVLHTPGHAPGHVSYFLSAGADNGNILFGGDALFQGSIGRTDLPGGNFNLLIKSIKEKMLTLPDDTVVLSGHGPDTTIGAERLSNPFLS